MKLICTADPRAWAEVVDVWTRKLIRDWTDILATVNPDDPQTLETADLAAKAYLRRVIKDIHLVDADGNEFKGLDAILDADNGTGLDNVDAAVVNWWKNLPWLAYVERQKMGEARRVN